MEGYRSDSAIMASLAAEVSLHCIICFEEFDVRDRPPVVLPCGHTYVCLVCAKRLRRCMECREPLYWAPPNTKAPPVLGNPGLNNTRSPAPARYAVPRGRYSPGTQASAGMTTPPVKEEQIPLPLPKNTVLMGMIEAAARQAKLLQAARQRQGHAKDDDNETDASTSPKSLSTLDPILAGLTALVGNCGTYAVREPLGLAVLPFDPNKRHHHETSHEGLDETDEEKKTDEIREPFTIEEGQKVQVVGVDEGVYQLARGAGYIVASVNQLVKVGGPLETSCQYEGMLRSVLQKQEELQRELDEINGLVEGLKEKIHLEQDRLPDHPVITSPREIEEILINDENDATARTPNAPTTPTNQHSLDASSPRLTGSASSTEVNLGADQLTPAQYTPPLESYIHSPAHSCPMPGPHLVQPFIDGEPTGLPRYRITSDDDLHGLPWTFGCGSTLFGERLIEQECDTRHIMSLSFDDGLVDSAERVAGRSLAARTIAANANLTDGTLRSGSFDGPINFRTGMSGHTGLSLSRKKSSPMSRPHIRMMSEHRGIAAVARAHQNLQPKRPPGALTYNHFE